MRGLAERSARNYFREKNEAAIKLLAQKYMRETTPLPDPDDETLSREEQTKLRRQRSQWVMQQHNKALGNLVEQAKSRGEWALYEMMANEGKSKPQTPTVQAQKREGSWALLNKVCKHFYRHFGMRLVVAYGFHDYSSGAKLLATGL